MTNGTSMVDRMLNYSNLQGLVAENLDWGNNTAESIMLAYIIDDG